MSSSIFLRLLNALLDVEIALKQGVNPKNAFRDALIKANNQSTNESLEVLLDFLNIEGLNKSNLSYIEISDDRKMPSYFLIRDINNHIQNQKNLSIFISSLVSMNNMNWNELHPEHLKLILNAFNLYENNELIKPIILEILNDLEIF